MRAVAVITLFSIGTVASPIPVRGEEAPNAPMTLEDEAALRGRILPHLLLVEVLPQGDPWLDPSFTPRRHGMAVRVTLAGRVVVLTSAALVEGARELDVSTAVKPEQAARGTWAPAAGGLAEVRCLLRSVGAGPQAPSPCDDGPAVAVAPAGASDPGRSVYAVVPAGAGRFVLVTTSIAARGVPLPEDLVLVQGRYPEGTGLFDAEGRVAAVVVRPAVDASLRSLAAPLAPRAPEPKSSGGPPDAPEEQTP